MRDEASAVHLQHQDVVHHPYLFTLYELHLALMSEYVHLQADAFTLVHMPRLGEKLDVKRLALYTSRCLWMNVASDPLPTVRVYPLPFLRVLPKILIGLSISCHNIPIACYTCPKL